MALYLDGVESSSSQEYRSSPEKSSSLSCREKRSSLERSTSPYYQEHHTSPERSSSPYHKLHHTSPEKSSSLGTKNQSDVDNAKWHNYLTELNNKDSREYPAELYIKEWYDNPALIGCPCCNERMLKLADPVHTRPQKHLVPRNNEWDPFGGYPVDQFSLYIDQRENDDHIHNPDPIKDAKRPSRLSRFCDVFFNIDRRALAALFALLVLSLTSVVLFIVVPAHGHGQKLNSHSVEGT